MMVRELVLAAALVAGAGGAVRADDIPQRIPQKARELADRGRAFHDAGDYTDAIAAFREAYVLAPSPGLLFNLAQAYRLGGDCDQAAWMYRRYLDTNPSPDHRAIAEGHLAAVAKCGHGGLQIVVLPPPQLEVKVPEPKLEPVASVTVHPAPVASGNRNKQIGTWLGIGGGIALAGAAIFALDANDAANTVAALYKQGGKWSDVAGADARGQRSAEIATVLGIGGGAALAAGAAFYLVGRHTEREQQLAVIPTAHGAKVSWTWSF